MMRAIAVATLVAVLGGCGSATPSATDARQLGHWEIEVEQDFGTAIGSDGRSLPPDRMAVREFGAVVSVREGDGPWRPTSVGVEDLRHALFATDWEALASTPQEPRVGGRRSTLRFIRSGSSVSISRHELPHSLARVKSEIDSVLRAADDETTRQEQAERERRERRAIEAGCRPGDSFYCGGDPGCPSCDVCIPMCRGADGDYRPER